MIHFRNDYSAGAHPVVLDALVKTNLELTAGYCCDPYCESAAQMIRDLCNAPDADVHFLVGGTQVNKTTIGAVLRPFEAVIAAHTGHICVHESAAIENNGHKVIHCPSDDGKVTPEMVRSTVNSHSSEHMVVPRLVYISNTTEVGTVYLREELMALRSVCNELGLLLYCDGARLGSAMTIQGADTSFADYAAA
ncbi:MAG: threonine aldolase, partial [Oscillospiraceae bacterium]|nr:threonine aldolase [Oscillospiraceae bacterium]